jgi:hypothetical protein
MKELKLIKLRMVMNPIILLSEQETMSRDLPPTTTLAMTLFLSSCLAGFYIYDIMKRNKSTEARVAELEHVVHETATLQESQSDILQEHDNRIREKKDYDEGEEIEEDKYQAWQGNFTNQDIQLRIYIWRGKISTKNKNQEWISWNKREEKEDPSVVVRDFYLGNSNPEFKWLLECDTKELFRVIVKDTMVNGWDSLIKIDITLSCKKKEQLAEFIGMCNYVNDETANPVLRKCIQAGLIQWSRILIDA